VLPLLKGSLGSFRGTRPLIPLCISPRVEVSFPLRVSSIFATFETEGDTKGPSSSTQRSRASMQVAPQLLPLLQPLLRIFILLALVNNSYPRSFLVTHSFNSIIYSRSICALARCHGFPVRKYSRLCSSIARKICAIGPFQGSRVGLFHVRFRSSTHSPFQPSW
jgi:hypothetical protein